jgi:chemotaxis-related protein WspB
MVTARPIPHLPAHVAGVFTHRGRLVPLVDLATLLGAPPLRPRLGTRVIVVDARSGHGPAGRLAMAAENVLTICSVAPAPAALPAFENPRAAYLGPVFRLDGRTLQLIAVEHLLPGGIAAAPPPTPPGTARAGSA